MAARLETAQKAGNRLLRDVSHELRSPLARQRVALELARSRSGEVVAAELNRIELESERLETLVDEVLTLMRETSRSSPFRPEDFDLGELLSDLAEVVSYELPDSAPGIEQQFEKPLQVHADRELLWRAVENLLRNALLHSDPAQPITLSARPLAPEAVEIRVRDRGPGVPESQLESIFDPFSRSDEARDRASGGHGLGLAIAAAAVRRHHGSLRARNHPGGGLELLIRMPVARAPEASSSI
jgi:two-component system sensor histidine kinase CpxA